MRNAKTRMAVQKFSSACGRLEQFKTPQDEAILAIFELNILESILKFFSNSESKSSSKFVRNLKQWPTFVPLCQARIGERAYCISSNRGGRTRTSSSYGGERQAEKARGNHDEGVGKPEKGA